MLRDAEKARLADPLQVTVGFSTFYIKPRVSYLWKDQAYDAKHDHFITFACTPKTKRLTVTGLRITHPAGKKTKNNVTFTLPASISALQQLSVLHLDGWRLIELPDLSPLTKLAHLSLQSNLFIQPLRLFFHFLNYASLISP
ncbi:MAG: hypothetical protein R3A45_06600 [Bdellovibrionota bacterium]